MALSSSLLLLISPFLLHFTTAFQFVTKNQRLNTIIIKSQNEDKIYFSPNNSHTLTSEVCDDIKQNENTEYSFFDEAFLSVKAGSGGQGGTKFVKGAKGQHRQENGGNGGKGGNVLLVGDPSLNTLAGLSPATLRPNSFGGSGATASTSKVNKYMSFCAENGSPGDYGFKNGKYGGDCIVRVPFGTVVYEEIQEEDGNYSYYEIGAIDLDSSELVVALGGDGGEGNGVHSRVKVKRPRSGAEGGEKKKLKLVLKVVADVALVAVPNAGKSTFLASVTRAKPKIANYPFTTLIPNLGVWVPEEAVGGVNLSNSKIRGAGSAGLILCDVPGLVAGAAEGRGLGHAFLRHVERCHVILHIIDATSADPVNDFQMINQELIRYGDGALAQKPQVVVVNKLDALEGRVGKEDWEQGLEARYNRDEIEKSLKEAMAHTRLMWMSAKESDGVEDLMSRLRMFVQKVKVAEQQEEQ